jgi:hypothetical protein
MLARRLLKSSFKPTYCRQFSTVINPEKKYVTLDAKKNDDGLLTSISQTFGNRDLGLSYIDGRHLHTDSQGIDFVRFNVSFSSNNDSDLTSLADDFSSQGIKMRNVDPVTVDWFPFQENHLDSMGSILQTPEDGLNQDHPGFTDKEYLARRDLISDTGKGYKMGNPIPGFEYNEHETGLWTTIWDRLYPKLMEHGCAEYKDNFQKLIDANLFQREAIPQL